MNVVSENERLGLFSPTVLIVFIFGVASLISPAKSAGQDPPNLAFVSVAGTDVQTGGPSYDFRISRFEIRNDEFVAFLNDAIENRSNERGRFLYFALDTGNVFIHSQEAGAVGTSGSGTLVFDAEVSGTIRYDGARFVVGDLRFEDHPVTGVTWFGALKFCNWLTIASGLSPDERVYGEGTNVELERWHPITISASDWTTRDLNDAERAVLVAQRGFRLPMDGGVDGVHLFGEWYKVASARRDAGGALLFDAAFGYGRSEPPGPADANFLDSGDPFEPETTPVGFFDGIQQLADQTVTRDTSNGFGLYDLSGNVWEWMQDQSPTDPIRRRNRGGSWASSPASLRNSPGASRNAATATNTTGFRIVQSVLEPLLVTPQTEIQVRGPWGGPLDPPSTNGIALRLANLTDDSINFTTTADEPWLRLTAGSGSIDGHDSVAVVASVSADCLRPLFAGGHPTTVRIEYGSGPGVVERTVQWEVQEPLDVTPPGTITFQRVHGREVRPSGVDLEITSVSDATVRWAATWLETASPPSGAAWLTLDAQSSASGDVEPHGVVALTVAVDETAADGLPVGFHSAQVSISDECTGSEFERTVELTIIAPFTVAPSAEMVSNGPFGGLFTPPSHRLTLTNSTMEASAWTAETCTDPSDCPGNQQVDWIELDVFEGVLAPGASASVNATLAPAVNTLPVGTHRAAIRFRDPATGYTLDRQMVVNVAGLTIEPVTELLFSGPRGGPFTPNQNTFALTNPGMPELHWTAEATVPSGDGPPWFEVQPAKGTILDPGEAESVVVSLSDEAPLLETGDYIGEVHFASSGSTQVRHIRLSVAGEEFSLPMVNVPVEDDPANGPRYFFRMGRFEVTNAEYARFLNDSLRHKNDARGQYLYHDTDSGSVFINDRINGEEGNAAPTTTLSTRLFDGAVGRIHFQSGAAEPYQVETGFDHHPVVGVTWYGAAKFCNWLTLVQAMPPTEQVYSEGPSANDWRALAFDPSDPLSNRHGFRLPMDGETLGPSIGNEWYKAATFASSEEDIVLAVFGFGRDALTSADANYLASGDSLGETTTPVGFYDGLHFLADAQTPTVDTGNGYGFYDLCGNVAEWVHELDFTTPLPRGATRGGNFLQPRDFIALTNASRESLAANSAHTFVGFRLAQSLSPIPAAVSQAETEVHADGWVGGPFSQSDFTLQLQNDAPYAIDNMSITIDAAWLEVDGPPPRQIPPHSSVVLPLRLTDAAPSLGLSPRPPGQMVMVPALDVQVGGPQYDYWISTTEVTNDQFVTFLNDAREHPRDGRGSYLYHDIDSGSVFLNDEPHGRSGTDAPSSLRSVLLYDADLGRIHVLDNRYATEAGFGRHPVVGVTWFGAVKYCNWLTLFAGLPEGVRAYTEGVSPEDWRPVTVSAPDWLSRGISDSERQTQIATAVGYRLPMDDESDGPAAFNEWYKAASARNEDTGGPAFAAVFGFGRDSLTSADANYIGSGDTEPDSTTPVGLFDGVNLLLDGVTPTNATANRYGLYDVTGNVAEWTQDFLISGDASRRSLRGGNWRHHAMSLELTNAQRISLPPSTAASFVGFRVVRGTGHIATIAVRDAVAGHTVSRQVVLDLHEPLQITPPDGMLVSGTFCDDFTHFMTSYSLRNASSLSLPWSARLEPSVNWLSINSLGAGPVLGELAPAPNGLVSLAVATTSQASLLPPGTHQADLVVTNSRTATTIVRPVGLRIDTPFDVLPEAANPNSELFAVWQGPFDALDAFHFSVLRREVVSSLCDVRYRASTSASWLTIAPLSQGADLEGAVPAFPATLLFTATINSGAGQLPVGKHSATVDFTLDRPGLSPSPSPIQQKIDLSILDPLRIEQDQEPWVICCTLDGAPWPTQTYALHNDHSSSAMVVSVEVDEDWVDVAPVQFSIPPQGSATLQATLNALALAPHGDYSATLRFFDTLTEELQTRVITVQIREDLSVTPLNAFRLSGVPGGPFNPGYAVYTLRNTSTELSGTLEWRAFADHSWVSFPGAAWGTVGPSQTVQLVVSIDSTAVPPPPSDVREHTIESAITIQDLTYGESVTRSVFVTVVDPQFEVNGALVGRSSPQPGGPGYSFVAGRFPVTNTEFVTFLNDALANLGSPRGQYLYFDTSNGDVFLNSQNLGELGPDSGGRSHKVFSPSVGRHIVFADNRYAVGVAPLDYSNHPVTGVSWYGALKYCNWLTLDQGWLPTERCYAEDIDANPGGWHPVEVSQADWESRDLTDAERFALVSVCRGFRLPMDDGYNNSTATLDSADDYNEWHKAAAWNDALLQNTVFGFGRNTLLGADANFRCSGDPFENPSECSVGASTPVGYFDGAVKSGSFATNPNANSFGLYDMTGNVHQWLQDRYAPPTSVNRRTLRGGSWNDPVQADSFRNSSRVLFASPDTLSRQIGFRVVRVPAIATGDFDGNGMLDLADWPPLTNCPAGPDGQPTPVCAPFDFDQDGDVDLLDVAQFLSRFSIP